jgi:hypothetical protein
MLPLLFLKQTNHLSPSLLRSESDIFKKFHKVMLYMEFFGLGCRREKAFGNFICWQCVSD